MKVSAQYAQADVADLLTAIDTGEEVKVARPGKPSVRLILVSPAPEKKRHLNGKRILGAGGGEMRVPNAEEWKQQLAKRAGLLSRGGPLSRINVPGRVTF